MSPAANTSAAVATSLGFFMTALGLKDLISQAKTIIDKMDPFHSNREVEYLGIWIKHQSRPPPWVITPPAPVGPVIHANLDGFGGHNALHLTRVPLTVPGKAGWSTLLSLFHTGAPLRTQPATKKVAEEMRGSFSVEKNPRFVVADLHEWDSLPQIALIRYADMACTVITRTTLITLMTLTNARKTFQYSDAAGFRAGYAGYNGQWYITWPIGQEAVVKFAPHDSHLAAKDVYPRSYVQRVDRCVQMLAGIVSARSADMKLAFCGRKASGAYVLEHVSKGFAGAHGSRHLYNMMGGAVYEVDFLRAAESSSEENVNGSTVLTLPSTDKGSTVKMIVPTKEEELIKTALDCLPWTSLSWSVHRGMRDILVAYARSTVDSYRPQLADLLRQTATDEAAFLVARGWEPTFVHNHMGDLAAGAIFAGKGDSGDLVRVVTDLALACTAAASIPCHDEVRFWRVTEEERKFDAHAVVALTKVFALEWSNEFDYQLYHELPISLYLG